VWRRHDEHHRLQRSDRPPRIEARSSLIGPYEFTQDIVQRNNVLEFRSVAGGTLQSLGSIDPFTGVFAVSEPVTDMFCVAFEGIGLVNSLNGVASASLPLFVGTGLTHVPTLMFTRIRRRAPAHAAEVGRSILVSNATTATAATATDVLRRVRPRPPRRSRRTSSATA
jgi:hypothetical protein